MADLKIIITPRDNLQLQPRRSSPDRANTSDDKMRLALKAYDDKIDELATETYDM